MEWPVRRVAAVVAEAVLEDHQVSSFVDSTVAQAVEAAALVVVVAWAALVVAQVERVLRSFCKIAR